MKRILHTSVGFFLLAVASAVLAVHPIIWLITTWSDPSYGSVGYAFMALVIVLVLRSVSSGQPGTEHSYRGPAVFLLLFAAAIRFFSQILAVNFLGGIALCIDAYALLTLLSLQRRPRAVSPFWLTVLVFLSLPVERLLQRFAGLVLQDASAFGACTTLRLFFEDVECAGTLLVLRGHDILVDLPCSGTASLMITLGSLAALFAMYRPGPMTAIFWTGISLFLSVAFNSLRVTLLALGVTFRDALPFDVMADPTHGLVGLFTLGLSLLPLFLWFRPKPWVSPPLWKFTVPSLPARYGAVTGGVVLCAAFAIVTAPRTAWDVSADVRRPILPTGIHGLPLENHLLSPMESTYFETYGGIARKASYGAMGVTVVRTTSPLRHLHSPEECLKGLGFEVGFLGTHNGAWPSSIYSATDAHGHWQVAVTFAASDGFVTANMSAVIWHWLKNPGAVWTSFQRITPAHFSDRDRRVLDEALMASLDVPRDLGSLKGKNL